MMRYSVCLALLLAAVPALADEPTPAPAAPALSLPQVPDGKARLIFIRSSEVTAVLANARVNADDVRLGSLGNGDAAAYDVAPGDLELRIANSLDWFGYMKARVTTAAGGTYYLHLWANSVFIGSKRRDPEGPLGDGTTICNGAWCLQEIGESEALTLLKGAAIAPPKD